MSQHPKEAGGTQHEAEVSHRAEDGELIPRELLLISRFS